MIRPKELDKYFYWRRNPKWYRSVDNTYEYEPTDAATEKAKESYAFYKPYVDDALKRMGATPYEGVILDL